MGQARLRGSREQRVAQAIASAKSELYKHFGMLNPESEEHISLKATLDLFVATMTPEEWEARKQALIERIKSSVGVEKTLENVAAIRDIEDEICWYLYLIEVALTDPLHLETNQASRTLPFMYAIGARIMYAAEIPGFQEKVGDILGAQRNAPDGLLFELMVALAYREAGWEVSFVDAPVDVKQPDLHIRKGDKEFFVECKRQSRRSNYAANEHAEFLKKWSAISELLRNNKQWIWLHVTFHKEVHTIDDKYLLSEISSALPLKAGEHTLVSNESLSIRARLIDKKRVRAHLSENHVKASGRMSLQLLGDNWLKRNAAASSDILCRQSRLVGGDDLPFDRWIDEIVYASGWTYSCDSSVAVNSKARDVKRLVVDATKQLPKDKPSIIHVAVETLDGRNVDYLRHEKILGTLADFKFKVPLRALFVHYIQCNEVVDKLWEVDESVDSFFDDTGSDNDFLKYVVLPKGSGTIRASHWELYPD